MNKVRIPADIESATGRLNGIDKLLTAKGWERAAIVAAFVRPQQGRRTDTSRSSTGSLTVVDFAGLGIRGLESDKTVGVYMQHWLDTHDGIHPEPGAEVELPTEAFPPTRPDSTGSRPTKQNIGRIIGENPEIAEAAAHAIADLIDQGELSEPVVARVYQAARQRAARPLPTGDRHDEDDLNIAWADWLNTANYLLITGARLAEKSEQPGVLLGVYAAAALMLYTQLTERRIDAEIRQILADAL